ncbi:MAG TPA: carbohydrate-binding protein [Candidatus Krumholzibacterium sp.]|nr:carbohydrate-binding protein [Candidatus Krumholzibacterium sp.]
MRNIHRITASITSVLAIIILVLYAVPSYASWVQVWSDEFNGTSLDSGNWNIDIGNGCPDLCGWGNNELQYYRAENLSVSGGYLTITAMEQSYAGYSYTSGKVHTRDKRFFLYGRIEMRAKIPTGGGMWPAFWMMPQYSVYGGWAASGELDIMESANATTSVGGALHFGGQWPNNTYTSGSYSLGGASFADDFHIYAVEWEPDEIRWYVDGALFMTRTSSEWYSDAAPGNTRAPFDQEFYIILNAAVGGNYTGCTSPSCITASLPQEYIIDYVRVYEESSNVSPAVSITSPGNGSILPTGDITIEAEASDSDGSVVRVEFYDGDTYLGEDTTAPYSFVWGSVPDGCYVIVARAIDDAGGFASDDVEITVGTGCGQGPYLGSPYALPARIEAEDFDTGGEGVAYHDSDSGNNGGQYRATEGVDIEGCADTGGGYNVGWTSPGEWLEYTVDVAAAGIHSIEVRVASSSTGGTLHIEFGGIDVTGGITVPVTGGWQNWTTVSTTATLSAGTQVMRVVFDTDGINLNYIEIPGIPTGDLPGPHNSGYALHACYPNPFNPSTTISYDLPEEVAVDLSVYDVTGRLVRKLVDGAFTGAGTHRIVWDGRNEAGRVVEAGVYFYRLEAGTFSRTRKMVLMR